MAAVVEHSVEHDADSAAVRFSDKLAQVVLCAEVAVDLGVIEGIVFVTGVGLKNRGHVYSADTDILEVVEPLGDSPESAAVAVVPLRVRKVAPYAEFFIMRRVMVAAKTVGHDLVPHRVAHPLRRRDYVGRIEPRVLEELL